MNYYILYILMVDSSDYIVVNGRARYSLGYADLEEEALFFSLYQNRAQLILQQPLAAAQDIWFYLDNDDFLIAFQFYGQVLRCQSLEDNTYSVDIQLEPVKKEVIEMLKTRILKKVK